MPAPADGGSGVAPTGAEGNRFCVVDEHCHPSGECAGSGGDRAHAMSGTRSRGPAGGSAE